MAAAARKPGREGGRPRRRARRPERQAQADPRHGPAQPREQRRDSRAIEDLVVALGRRHVHERPADRVAVPPAARRACAVAALLVHRAGHGRRCWHDEGDLWAFVSDNTSFDDYYDFTPGSTQSVERALHQGAEGHRHGPRSRTAPSSRRPTSATRLPPTDGSWQTDLRHRDRPGRSASTARSGCSSTGVAPQQRVPASSASRTSPTTSGPAWRTSSTSSTRDVAPPGRLRSQARRLVDQRPRLEVGARPETTRRS